MTITGIEVFAHHGVLPREREEGQLFLIDVLLELDLSRSTASDELVDTVDYAVLAQRLHAAASGGAFSLIERLAGALLDICLEEELVQAAEVTVHKPFAPVSVAVGDITVTVRRERA